MRTRTIERGGAWLLALAMAAGCDPGATADDGNWSPDDPGASSSDDGAAVPDEPPPGPNTLEGDVILRNRVALDMPIRLRPLADDVQLDCEAVAEDPVAGLPDESFAEGEVHTLSPHEMVVVWPHEPGLRPCYAVRVEHEEGLGVRLLFWRDGEPPIRRHAESCCDVGEGVVELMPVDGGFGLELLGNTWLVHDPGA